MNVRQKEIIDDVVDGLMPCVSGRTREEIGELLYNLVIDCRQPPRLGVREPPRRAPAAGEVLPPHQRASWARATTEYDDVSGGVTAVA